MRSQPLKASAEKPTARPQVEPEYDDEDLYDDELPPAPSRRRGFDLSDALTRLGVLGVAVSIGLLLFLVNGAFSVAGLQTAATALGGWGIVFWQLVSGPSWRLPFVVPDVPQVQPLVPWVLVVSSSLIELGILARKWARQPIGFDVALIGTLVTVYDAATTFYGVGTWGWIVGLVPSVKLVLQLVLTAFFTLGFELLIAPVVARFVRKEI